VCAGSKEVKMRLLDQLWISLEEGRGPKWRRGDVGAEGFEMRAETTIEEEMEEVLKVAWVAGPGEGSGM